ncbi:MAG TPA: PQQ-binding-like beta-propeller repeat protein, partial [Gemmatimonadales bacterium]|nr:PQQ-binding-like beta-propeller repeat protein [Gemmatimonadales bacterium]
MSFTLASGTAAQSEPLWRYTAPAKIRGFQVTPLGSLLVQTDSGTVTLDPDSGSTIWARSDMRWISLISRTALALTWLDPGGPVLWDLESGRALTDSLPFESVRGLITLPERGLVLVHGPTAESPATLAAISLDSAGIRWRQDSLFSRVVREPDHFKKLSLTGQPPIVDQDSGVILYPNYGGPIKLDLFSGALRWRADSLANRDPPTRRDGWSPPLLHQGVLYVPYEKRMMALRSGDGQVLWDRQDKLEGRAFQLAHTPHGLLVLTVPGPNDV